MEAIASVEHQAQAQAALNADLDQTFKEWQAAGERTRQDQDHRDATDPKRAADDYAARERDEQLRRAGR